MTVLDNSHCNTLITTISGFDDAKPLGIKIDSKIEKVCHRMYERMWTKRGSRLNFFKHRCI